jgi:hypothetical protein
MRAVFYLPLQADSFESLQIDNQFPNKVVFTKCLRMLKAGAAQWKLYVVPNEQPLEQKLVTSAVVYRITQLLSFIPGIVLLPVCRLILKRRK